MSHKCDQEKLFIQQKRGMLHLPFPISRNVFHVIIGDAGERRRLLWNAFYLCLWKELLLLAVNFMLC
jgi:hypothetical protein